MKNKVIFFRKSETTKPSSTGGTMKPKGDKGEAYRKEGSKYIRKVRGKNGKWIYIYKESEGKKGAKEETSNKPKTGGASSEPELKVSYQDPFKSFSDEVAVNTKIGKTNLQEIKEKLDYHISTFSINGGFDNFDFGYVVDENFKKAKEIYRSAGEGTNPDILNSISAYLNFGVTTRYYDHISKVNYEHSPRALRELKDCLKYLGECGTEGQSKNIDDSSMAVRNMMFASARKASEAMFGLYTDKVIMESSSKLREFKSKSNFVDSDVLAPIAEVEKLQSFVKMFFENPIGKESIAHKAYECKPEELYQNSMNLACDYCDYIVGICKDKFSTFSPLVKSQFTKSISRSATFDFLSFSHMIYPIDGRMGVQASPEFNNNMMFSYVSKFSPEKWRQDSINIISSILDVTKGDSRVSAGYGYIQSKISDIFNGKHTNGFHEDSKMPKELANSPFFKRHPSILDIAAVSFEGANSKLQMESFVRLWSIGSHYSVITNCLELFANDKGLDRSSFVNWHYANNKSYINGNESVNKSLLNSINSTYQETQKYMAGSSYVLFRGDGKEELKPVAASFSTDSSVAQAFGSHYTIAEIPAECVIAHHQVMESQWYVHKNEKEAIVAIGINPQSCKFHDVETALDKKVINRDDYYRFGGKR